MHLFQEICRLHREGRHCLLLTVVETSGTVARGVGSRMLLLDDGTTLGSIGGGTLESQALSLAREVEATGISVCHRFSRSDDAGETCDGSVTLFIELLAPDAELIIVGSGHVGRSLSMLAACLGPAPLVIDDRVPDAGHPMPGRLLQVAGYEGIFGQVPVGRRSMLIICTRSHSTDLLCLRQALCTEAGFIGLLGSRRKLARFSQVLIGEGLDGQALERIHCPVGVDIGAETPQEIAVSIMAQLIQWQRRKMR